MKIKLVKLPPQVLERFEIVGNIFDLASKREEFIKNWFDSMVSELASSLQIKGDQWNKEVAPILRKKGKELGIKWLG